MAMMQADAHIHKRGTFNLTNLMEGIRRKGGFQKVGAIALFIGVVRGETAEGKKVRKMEVEAYEEGANEALTNICNDLMAREGVIDVQIHHLIGEFEVGDDLVYVLVAGSHRKDVFTVLAEAVERYKVEAPIFKKEYVVDEKGDVTAYWVAERGT